MFRRMMEKSVTCRWLERERERERERKKKEMKD